MVSNSQSSPTDIESRNGFEAHFTDGFIQGGGTLVIVAEASIQW